MYEIEAKVPRISPGLRMAKYPFRIMKVGDSFFVPKDQVSGRGDTVRASCSHYRIKLGHKYEMRTVVEHDRTGYRVWRIA